MDTGTSGNRHSSDINDEVANLPEKVVLDSVNKECEWGERSNKPDSYTNSRRRLHKDLNRSKQYP